MKFRGKEFKIDNLLWIIPLLFVSATIAIFAMAGDGHYRYPCQDPANWNKTECTPPECEADGTCAKHLISGGTKPAPLKLAKVIKE